MALQKRVNEIHGHRRPILPTVRWKEKTSQKRLCISRLKKLGLFNREGMIAANNGYFENAMFQLTQALNLANSLGSPLHLAKVHNSIALLHQLTGHPQKAERAFLTAEGFAIEGAGEGNTLHKTILRNIDHLRQQTKNKAA